ncbi:MAG: 16S rRNA (guanine(966)-N(2))-methyltransferase RsmD [Chlamydiales bacterium]|nr:16S rRNA (guanine(966)-N(2))-methyltransferase RsmD [Chlamydiales bacterium]
MQIIGGKHKKRKLYAPKTTEVRPTSAQLRETVFNICQQQIEGARFLDLFAGSGAIGLEALSRGAAHTTFVERGRPALAAIKRNLSLLGEQERATLIAGDVLAQIPLLNGPFDLIYIDPPYGKGLGAKALEAIDAHKTLAEGGTVFIEDSSFEEPSLKRLVLKHKRQVGRATLFEYAFSLHLRLRLES